MGTRRVLSVALASAAASLTVWVGPAGAGGWWSWIQLDDTYLAIGEQVTARATVMFPTVAEADEARVHQGYAAYLLRGIDVAALEEAMMVPEPGAWWSPPEVVLEVGAVELKDGDANLLVAEASFTVPQVETGEWALMFCDAGCVNPLADVAPTMGLHIAADPQSAAIAREVDALAFELEEQRVRLTDRITELERSLREADGVGRRSADGVRELGARVTELESGALPVAAAGGAGWIPVGGGIVGGVALASILPRKRRL